MNSKNVTDMTVGNPTKHIITFALPLLIGNLFQQFYNMVDSLIVGNYVGSDALAAVGTCGSTSFLFFSLSSGLAIGIGVIVAQFFGAKDYEYVRKTIANSFYVLISAAITVSVLGLVFAPVILRLLSTPADIIDMSVTYMRTTCLGIIFVALYNGVAAILRALGDSRTPLYFLILSSVVNVVLDLVFVLYFSWGVFGVAFATIIAQMASAVACLVYAFVKIPYFKMSKEQRMPKADIIAQSFKLGVPIALQNAMIAVSSMALQGVVNGFGTTVMASYTIIMRIEQIVQQFYGSISSALTTYSGQNIGANKIDRVKQGYRQTIIIAAIFSIIMIPVTFGLGEQIVGFFVKEREVIDIAKYALRINGVCYFALGMIYVPRAVLNGCGDTGFAILNGVTEVACRIGYSQIFTRIPALGFWGIWVTIGVTWITTAIVCVIRYASGIWKTKALRPQG
ncbi:MAG: MATE family efflux transporter [Lachnospiraceae bacterium]|nr:MATE family efflux transporter [Lachnospiraceae bacterium]